VTEPAVADRSAGERVPAIEAVDVSRTYQLDGVSVQALRGQTEERADACAALGRDVGELDRILLTGFTPDRGRPLESVNAFVDFAGRHQELGFTEIVIHWPIPDSDFAADERVFERIALEAPAQLR
jgi:hypothetical protein